jgi:hypothetical protein
MYSELVGVVSAYLLQMGSRSAKLGVHSSSGYVLASLCDPFKPNFPTQADD